MKAVKIFAAAFACLVILKAGFALAPYPELKEFTARRYSTRVFDTRGRLIYIVPLENGLRREYVPYEQIPSEVRKEVLRAEDSRFYFHCGIDVIAAFRALIQNSRGNHNVSGASTVSMQLAKMISPSSKRNFAAKMKDCLNALRLEARFSKKQIFQLYINNLPFGKNCEGIASAARMYFSKDLDELSAEEIETLSKIPRNPSLYSPVKNRGNYDSSFINCFPHYMAYLQKNYDSVFAECYEVQLFCDAEVQLYAEDILKRALESAYKSRIYNGAVYVCDVKTGGVVAWVGSQSWNDFQNSGQIDGVLNCMQPGSSMKPFLYALAMEKQGNAQPVLKPSDVLADVPKEYGSRNVYIPQNFNNRYNGPVRTRVALASSLNVPAVDLLDRTGMQRYLDTLSALGFKSLEKTDADWGLSLALGSGEVSIKELTEAFSVFVRDGMYMSGRHFRKRIFISRKRPGPEQKMIPVFSPDISRIICSFLSDKKARSLGFGYSQSFETDYPAIFKTGTSNQFQNITALGATREFAAGVWMGNFNGHTVIGKTGSSLPAWQVKQILDFMCSKIGKYEELAFPEPESFHLEEICALSGMKPSSFCRETVFEYVRNGEEFSECSWHLKPEQGGKIEIQYPPEYQQWFLNYGQKGKIDYDAAPLEIQVPKNESVFYIDDSKTNIPQVVPFEVVGGRGENLYVYENGKLLTERKRPFSFNIVLRKGMHHVSVQCGEEIQSVDFTVR